jgi:hypothetical protein
MIQHEPSIPASELAGEPVPTPQVHARKRSGRALNLALGLALVVAIGGVAFAVGRATAPAGIGGLGRGPGVLTADPGALGGPGAQPGGFLGLGGLAIEGTVTAIDADSMTIETANGASIEVSLDGDTEYHQQAEAAAADVEPGSSVIVQVDGLGRPVGAGPGASAAPAGNDDSGTATDITVVP